MSAFLIFVFFGSAKIQDWNYPNGKRPEISSESEKQGMADGQKNA